VVHLILTMLAIASNHTIFSEITVATYMAFGRCKYNCYCQLFIILLLLEALMVVHLLSINHTLEAAAVITYTQIGRTISNTT